MPRYQRELKKRLFPIRGDVRHMQKINSHILIIVEKRCNSKEKFSAISARFFAKKMKSWSYQYSKSWVVPQSSQKKLGKRWPVMSMS
jgi:hypothetical protein